MIDPALPRFGYASVRATFREGRPVGDLARGPRDGSIAPTDVPPIRVLERGGMLFALDNRRLWASREAGADAPSRMATDDGRRAEAWKFTTTNNGASVRVTRGR